MTTRTRTITNTILAVVALLLVLNLIGLPTKQAHGQHGGGEHEPPMYMALLSFETDPHRQHPMHRRIIRIRVDGACEFRTLELGPEIMWMDRWQRVLND